MTKVVQVFEQNEYVFSDGIKRIVPIQLWPIDKSSYRRRRTVFVDNTTNYRIVSNVETVLKPYEWSPKDIKPKIEVKSEYDIKPNIKCESRDDIKPLLKIEPKEEDKEVLKHLLKKAVKVEQKSPTKATEESSQQSLKRQISSEELTSNKRNCTSDNEIVISDSEIDIDYYNETNDLDESTDVDVDVPTDQHSQDVDIHLGSDETTNMSEDSAVHTVPMSPSVDSRSCSDHVSPVRSKWVTPPSTPNQSDSDNTREEATPSRTKSSLSNQSSYQSVGQTDADQTTAESSLSPVRSTSDDSSERSSQTDTDEMTVQSGRRKSRPKKVSPKARKKPSNDPRRRLRSYVKSRQSKPSKDTRKLRSVTKKVASKDLQTDESTDSDNSDDSFIVDDISDESEDSDEYESDDESDGSSATPEESEQESDQDMDEVEEDNSDEPDETDSGTDEFEYSLEKSAQNRDNTKQNISGGDILLPTVNLNQSSEQSIDENEDNCLSDGNTSVSDSDDSVPSEPKTVSEVLNPELNSRTKVLEIILSYLPLKDKLRLETVCKQWQQIIIRQQKKLNITFDIRFPTHRCVRFLGDDIEFINFSNEQFVSIWQKLVSKFTELNDIQVFNKTNLNSNSIVQIINDNIKKLDSIRLFGTISTDMLIRFGLLFGSELKTIDINSGDYKLTYKELIESKLLSNNLRTVYVFKSILNLTVKQLPQLRELLDVNINDIIGLKNVANCYEKQIKKISFRVEEYLKDYRKVTESLRQLSRFECLEYLDFYFADNVLTDELKPIESLRNLKELHVFGKQSHLNLKHLSGFKHLKVLGLFFDCPLYSPLYSRLNFSALHSLDLTELWMYCDISVNEMESLLKAMKNLKTLHLISNLCYEKEIVHIIGSKNNLTTIYLEDCLITAKTVREMLFKVVKNPTVNYSIISEAYADRNSTHECYRIVNEKLPKNMTIIIHNKNVDPFQKLLKQLNTHFDAFFKKERQPRIRRRNMLDLPREAPDPQQCELRDHSYYKKIRNKY